MCMLLIILWHNVVGGGVKRDSCSIAMAKDLVEIQLVLWTGTGETMQICQNKTTAHSAVHFKVFRSNAGTTHGLR
jgi:hypothetical protein